MRIEDLTLDEKCRLLGGASTWRTHAIADKGVPPIMMSDGPNGVRGERSGAEGIPGVVIPVGIAMGATWDRDLVGRLGDLLGKESHRRAAHVLLAPTVNIIRTPVGGRTFECFSEDAELTAQLAVSYIRAVQDHDVAVTVKHFVGNDTEVERATVDARIPESALREIYLRPFEASVLDANAWGVMSAYNRVDGEFCAENSTLLIDLLREEWGFDGFVVSDWDGAHNTVEAGNGGLTVAMPGPRSIFGEALADAVRSGAVPEEAVDARVAEVFRLAERTHAATLSADRVGESVDDPAERALCREAATSSIVLVHNNDADGTPSLPIAAGTRVAVVGPNATRTRIMGGGSSSLRPLPYRSILDAVTDRFGSDFAGYAEGTSIEKYVPIVDAGDLRGPDGEEGLLIEYRNGSDPNSTVVATSRSLASAFTSFGTVPDGVETDGEFNLTLVGEYVPTYTGPHTVGAMLTGKSSVVVGDTVVVDDPERLLPRGDWLFGYACEEQLAEVDLVAGEPVPVRFSTTGIRGLGAIRVGFAHAQPESLLEPAVELAADADVTVVVVGTSDEWETEGVDRTTIALPGDQDELIRRVAAVSPRTVVVVNAGGPVAMPWIDQVDAVMIASFAGIETGPAVAAVLAGDTDPGGRLPVTYPVQLEDSPAWPHYMPVDGVQTYGEGRFVGYRGHEQSGVDPLFAFGHGLSYGTSEWGQVTLSSHEVRADASVEVSVALTNIGDRDVTDVVQVYVTHPDPTMPARTLAGFTKSRLSPGESRVVTVELDQVAWRRWDDTTHGWVVDEGERQLIVASSAVDERARVSFKVTG